MYYRRKDNLICMHFKEIKYYIFQIPTRNNNVRTIQGTGAYYWGKLYNISLENLKIY